MAGTPGTIRFAEINSTPSAPPPGYTLLYVKTDNVVYVLDSSNVEIPLGSAASITQLLGDVTATGPGSVTATVVSVAGKTASEIAASVAAYEAATANNTPSTIVERDSSGNFIANIITAALNGNAATATFATSATTSTTSTNFTGSLNGDVTGTQSFTVVSYVGGKTAADVASATTTVDAATSANTASTLVERDASGNFSANIITAALNGNATTATTSTNFTGSLSGDVTGTQSATLVSKIDGTTVSGTTGTTNVVFSASPTLTGTLTAAIANFSGNVSATNNTQIANSTTAVATLGAVSSTTVHQINGGQSGTTKTITASTYAVDSTTTDYLIYADSTSNPIAITLPPPTNGRSLVIEGIAGSAFTNNITINPNSTEKINGASSFLINQNYGSIRITSNGTNWFVTSTVPNVNSTILPVVTIPSTTIDWSKGSMFTQTLSTSTTFTFANATAGQVLVIRLTNTASNYTVTWPTIRWPVAIAPSMSPGAVSDVYTILYDGSNYYGSYVQNMS